MMAMWCGNINDINFWILDKFLVRAICCSLCASLLSIDVVIEKSSRRILWRGRCCCCNDMHDVVNTTSLWIDQQIFGKCLSNTSSRCRLLRIWNERRAWLTHNSPFYRFWLRHFTRCFLIGWSADFKNPGVNRFIFGGVSAVKVSFHKFFLYWLIAIIFLETSSSTCRSQICGDTIRPVAYLPVNIYRTIWFCAVVGTGTLVKHSMSGCTGVKSDCAVQVQTPWVCAALR